MSTADRMRRLSATTKLARIEEEGGELDREFWRTIPPAKRLEMVWDIVLEHEGWGHAGGGQQRLQRSVCRIERR